MGLPHPPKAEFLIDMDALFKAPAHQQPKPRTAFPAAQLQCRFKNLLPQSGALILRKYRQPRQLPGGKQAVLPVQIIQLAFSVNGDHAAQRSIRQLCPIQSVLRQIPF